MRLLLNLSSLGLIAGLLTAPAPAQTARVGTFRRQSVVVAYYRSPLWSDMLRQKRAEMNSARQAGDAQRMKELDKWGGEEQERADRQLAGEAPITNILKALKPAFAEIEAKTGVSAIEAEHGTGPSVQTVDVTGDILDWLKADAATRKIIQDLRSR